MLIGPVNLGANLVVLTDGTWEAFSCQALSGRSQLTVSRSTDHGRSWSEPREITNLEGDGWSGVVSLLDRRNELQLFVLRIRKEGSANRIAIDRWIDIWHLRSHKNRTEWAQPGRIFKGYVGSVQMATQLRNGRLVLPFAYWVPGKDSVPPTGSHETTTLYSDDDGQTWPQSTAKLTAPCYPGFNGNNYGAIEPVVLELKDRHIWMLMRTQTGFLYESFSRDGIVWSEAKPSKFRSSTSPAYLLRLADGRIGLFWNNCEMPPRVNGEGVYGGRDALHGAISSDEGESWRGFREVYRDPYRNEPPPRTGDRGTAYPRAHALSDGGIALISGQGEKRRTLILIDPEWLLLTRHEDDFHGGLEGWSVFKSVGPALGWWRSRLEGAQLVHHPGDPLRRVLTLRKVDENPADGAMWNFPAGRKGRLTIRLMLRQGFSGASIGLLDHFADPTDDAGDSRAVFKVEMSALGQMGPVRLQTNEWHNLRWEWDLGRGYGSVSVGGKSVNLFPRNKSNQGLSYLRLRSTAQKHDRTGWLAEHVNVDVVP